MEFRRCDGFSGCIPQNFINTNFPVCPFCGSHDPYWTLKDKLTLVEHLIFFKCKDCGCILSATEGDFTGRSQSDAATALTYKGTMNALVKSAQGKDVKQLYMKVEDCGTKTEYQNLVGQELPIEYFKNMAAAYDAPQPQPVQNAPQPQPVQYAPQPQPVQYTPQPQPVQYTPQPQPVQYTPQPQPVQYTPQPQPVQYTPQPQPGQYTPQPRPGQQAPQAPSVLTPVNRDAVADELRKYHSLLSSGLLSEAEYEETKASLLKEL